jgi:hypothetical protein
MAAEAFGEDRLPRRLRVPARVEFPQKKFNLFARRRIMPLL